MGATRTKFLWLRAIVVTGTALVPVISSRSATTSTIATLAASTLAATTSVATALFALTVARAASCSATTSVATALFALTVARAASCSATTSVATAAVTSAIAITTPAATFSFFPSGGHSTFEGPSGNGDGFGIGLAAATLRWQNCFDENAIERKIGIGPAHVTDACAIEECFCVEGALRLFGARGAPRPSAVSAVTGQLDVDTACHGELPKCGRG